MWITRIYVALACNEVDSRYRCFVSIEGIVSIDRLRSAIRAFCAKLSIAPGWAAIGEGKRVAFLENKKEKNVLLPIARV